MKKKTMLLLIVFVALMLCMIGCGNQMSDEEKLILNGCKKYQSTLLRPETFRVYSGNKLIASDKFDQLVKMMAAENDIVKDEWKKLYLIDYGAESSAGIMQENLLAINMDTGKCIKYSPDAFSKNTSEVQEEDLDTLKYLVIVSQFEKNNTDLFESTDALPDETIELLNKNLKQ